MRPHAYILLAGIIFWNSSSNAQTGAGSSTIDNSIRSSLATETTYEYAESLYIGPNAIWNIEGEHIIYSRFIWIAPAAQITGTGKLVIADPGANPFYPDMPAGETTVDGNNGNLINLTIEHQNPGNILLSDIVDPGFGTTNPAGALAATLNIGGNFDFQIDDGDVILNGNNFVFGESSTVANYSADRMVVTGNSIAGHMVKVNTATTPFFFPIGINEGDYTPVEITGANTYHISVTDYAASTITIAVPEEGMDRVWHVYGGAADNITLYHNSPATNGLLYDDEQAFITRYLGGNFWTSSGAPDYIMNGIHSNSSTISASIPVSELSVGTWLTKSSDQITVLPVRIANFEVTRLGSGAKLKWLTLQEFNNKGFYIEHSADGQTWESIGFVNSKVGTNTTEIIEYTFTDNTPASGINYYRLKQIDQDGKFEYSVTRFLRFESGILLYPNPAKEKITITGLNGNETVSIRNNTGQLLQTIRVNGNTCSINIQKLSKGLYYVSIAAPDALVLKIERLVKQ